MSSNSPDVSRSEKNTEKAPQWQPPVIKKSKAELGEAPHPASPVAEIRGKIYPRSVTGTFATWRIIFVYFTQIIFYGLPWLQWNGRQAVLFDLGARKFYLFGLVLWPQDIIYLTVLLIISAYGLFLFTAVAGRLFCGYACPQTVYTEIFMWIERKVEGDRVARIRLDEQPMNARKFRIKFTKHFLWVAVAFWTGFTFIGYFAPIRELGGHLINLTLGPWQWFWLIFYSFATWGNAGFLREAVCKYMCPYARFQSVMVDQDTMVVSYDYVRGEPRGARSRKTDHKKAGLGDCINCTLCVQVCPTGIDIRDGLQYMCIGCGHCVDVCNEVMNKMGYEPNLIRYTSGRAIAERLDQKQARKRIFRPRVLVYTTLLVVILAIFFGSLATRSSLKLDVIRDRGSLGRIVDERTIENVYRLQIANTREEPVEVRLSASGLEGLEIVNADNNTNKVILEPASNQLIPVIIRAPYNQDLTMGMHPIKVQIETDPVVGRAESRVESTNFYVPAQ